MKIQILETIDSDGNPDVEVFVDGKRAGSTNVEVVTETVDPGRGYDWVDWFPRIEEAYKDTQAPDASEYDKACLEALLWGAVSRYVEKPDDWREDIKHLTGEPIENLIGIG